MTEVQKHNSPELSFEYSKYDKTLGDLPSYATKGSAGLDLKACLPEESVILKGGQRTLIPTSLYPKFSDDTLEIQIRPRSGLAYKHGITVLNSPGTIDSDYTGEIKVLLYNTSEEDFEITHGMRIAQAVISRIVRVTTAPSSTEHRNTARVNGGFGSTGY